MKKGQELIEFALVLPFLVFIVFGALAIANVVSSNTQLTQAATRAALDASNIVTSSSTNCSDAFSAAQVAASEVVTSSLVTVTQLTVDCDASNPSAHDVCSRTGSGTPLDTLTGAPTCGTASFIGGKTLSVKLDAQIDVSLFGFGPSLGISSTGASIIPGRT
jgi:Flp pilus assembly protein TadG